MSFNNLRSFQRWKRSLNQVVEERLRNHQNNLRENSSFFQDYSDESILDHNDDNLNQSFFDNSANNELNLTNNNQQVLINNLPADPNSRESDSVEINLNNEANDKVIKEILKIVLENNLSKNATESILNLLNFVKTISRDKNQPELKIPNSLYQLKKEVKINLTQKFGFFCKDCESLINFEISNDLEQIKNEIKCTNPSCSKVIKKRDIICSKNYYSIFNIEQLIECIFDNYNIIPAKFSETIDTFFDGKIYKYFYELLKDKQMVSLMFFSDGVPVFNSNKTQLYPIFMKVNEIDSSIENKIFMVGCYVTTSKPDVNFFLKHVVNDLNRIFNDGVFINRLNIRVYPVVMNFLFDVVARRLFLNHVNFNTEHGCTDCYKTGERIKKGKGSVHVYKYIEDEVIVERSVEDHKLILDILNKPNGPNKFLGKFFLIFSYYF